MSQTSAPAADTDASVPAVSPATTKSTTFQDVKNIVYVVTLVASFSVFVFTLGRTFTSVTQSFVTQDGLKEQLEEVLFDKTVILSEIDARVSHNEENLVIIQEGVSRLLKQSEAEAMYIDAQSVYQKYLKDWEDQLQTWSIDREEGRRSPRPVKRPELIEAELAASKAKAYLMRITVD